MLKRFLNELQQYFRGVSMRSQAFHGNSKVFPGVVRSFTGVLVSIRGVSWYFSGYHRDLASLAFRLASEVFHGVTVGLQITYVVLVGFKGFRGSKRRFMRNPDRFQSGSKSCREDRWFKGASQNFRCALWRFMWGSKTFLGISRSFRLITYLDPMTQKFCRSIEFKSEYVFAL